MFIEAGLILQVLRVEKHCSWLYLRSKNHGFYTLQYLQTKNHDLYALVEDRNLTNANEPVSEDRCYLNWVHLFVFHRGRTLNPLQRKLIAEKTHLFNSKNFLLKVRLEFMISSLFTCHGYLTLTSWVKDYLYL